MRRMLAVVACLVAILGLLAPAAFAQGPTPKVTIVGLFDQITSASQNVADGNFARKDDKEWYARTRFRPDFTFEVGRTKAVLGLEFDIDYGQQGVCGAGGTKATGLTAAGGAQAGDCTVGEKPGSTASAGLNTDVTAVAEVKWMYTEFDLTGKDALLPFIPVATVARAGLQPFGTYGGLVGTYRATLTQGDFAGFTALTTWAPNVKTGFAYVQIEDQIAGSNRAGFVAGFGNRFTRGDDSAIIFTPEITPFKGLDIKPVYAYTFLQGTTSSQARRAATNITTGAGTGAALVAGGSVAGASAYQLRTDAAGNAQYTNGDPSQHENRHTIGVDARWRSGAWGLDPTILYQFGTRHDVVYDNPSGGAYQRHDVGADMSSWLTDVQGSYQWGPLLLEGRAMYTTGNKARDNIGRSIKYYEPIDLDTGYWAGWSAIFALGVDYFNGGGGMTDGMSTNIGYDRYGRAGFGVRATYNLTPDLSLYTSISPMWTAQKVDTDTNMSAGGIRVCSRTADVGGVCFVKGDASYLGTEADLGTTWRFAPNTAFDLQGAFLGAGDALSTRECATNTAAATCYHKAAHDAWTVAARVRLSF